MSESGTTSRDEGARLLQAGDLDGALARLQQAVLENPGDGRAHSLLGICQARRGDLVGSVASLSEAVRLLPQDAAARYNLATALVQAGRADEARGELERALALNPEHAASRALLERVNRQPDGGTPTMAAPPGSPVAGLTGGSTPLPGVSPAAPAGTFGAPTGVPAPGAAVPAAPFMGAPGAASQPPPADPGAATYAAPPAAGPPAWPAPGAALGQAPGGMYAPPPVSSAAPAQQGMVYAPSTPVYAPAAEPSLLQRLLRGWGWGTLYGQIWTVLFLFWETIHGSIPFGWPTLIAAIILFMIFGFAGTLAGLVIALVNPDDAGTGAMIGAGTGILLGGIEFLLAGNPAVLINLIFWFFTGRMVGRGIVGRVQQPVQA